ncbi:MAG: hypothetical protein WCA28_16765 [Bradyrhizobium sp.]
MQLAPVLIDARKKIDGIRGLALRDEGADPFRFVPERFLRRTDWLAKWVSDADFLCDKHRTIALAPTTGRTPMNVLERDIAAAIDPVITRPPRRGRHAGTFGQSNLTFSGAQEGSQQNPADFARKRQ